MNQSTIARKVVSAGLGLHSGEDVEITLLPAPVESGIVFVLRGAGEGDGEGEGDEYRSSEIEVPADIRRVYSSSRATTLATEGYPSDGRPPPHIATVEHLLAAIFALDIQNLRIEVFGSEVPIMDGSALPFVVALRSAGRVTQDAPRREFEVEEPFEIREGDRSIRVEPANDLRISYGIDFDHPKIGRQFVEILKLDDKVFEQEIAPARTFGFLHEVEALRKAGLAIGGSLDTAVVLDEEGVLNAGGLRWPDEFVRHKVIDLVGDLALLGARPKAHIKVERGGHRLHHRLVEELETRMRLGSVS
ncbi:MAG: UDP-3-O-acyl-N-acetylglucosamine deacetylase [Myxococcales bacterium]